MHGYYFTDKVTHLRVHTDGSEWFIDGADDSGDYTEACWSYDSFAGAVAALPEFYAALSDYGVTFTPDPSRPRGASWRKGKNGLYPVEVTA